ncbi:transporter%2C divalent anion:Na+ symporter (DASS) family [uncultured Clostridium sp.]|nr:hypothetical protein [Clostridium sp.]SCH95578.1 transporter%2C divalent anion:Na+ symporter (DASS) family [uncultured Clostridium sp.]
MASSATSKKIDVKYYLFSIIGLLFMFGFGYLDPPDPITPMGMKIGGIFIGLLFLWSAVGIAWPSILGILALGTSGYCTMTEAIAASMGSSVIWQVLMFMFIGGAITESGLAEFIARWSISRPFVKGKPELFVFSVFLGFMAATIMTISAGMLFLAWTVIYNITDMVGYRRDDPFTKMMIIFTSIACALGEFIIPFKGWTLALCESYHVLAGESISYTVYMIVATIIALLIIMFMVLLMKYVFKADLSKLIDFDTTTLLKEGSRLTLQHKFYLGAFIFIIASTLAATVLPGDWAIARLVNHVTTSGIFALTVAVLCFVKIGDRPIMDFRSVSSSSVKWEAVFICAAVIPIAAALTSKETGVINFFGSLLGPVFEGRGAFTLLAFVLILTTLITNIGSNTGTALLLIAIAVPLGKQVGVSMGMLGMSIIYSACFGLMLPGASAISAIFYTNENLKAKDILLYTGAVCLIYIVIGVPLFYIAGKVI